ncbi:MAG: response regulator [Bacteroidales bacterium]|nr:response regulator [Bacteroidales bacterium]
MNLAGLNFQGETFLIADGDSYCLDLMRRMLEMTGAEVLDAHTGDEAIKIMLTNENVTSAILSSELPVFSGLEVVKQVTNLRDDILFFMSTTNPYRMYEVVEHPAVIDCIYKPISPKNLMFRISNALKIRHLL